MSLEQAVMYAQVQPCHDLARLAKLWHHVAREQLHGP
jgi:hypothetical protein